MRVELTGHTKYFYVKDNEGNEYTSVMMVDENSKNVDWEVFTIFAETEIPVDEELKNKIIEAVIGFEEKKSLGE